MVTDVSAGQKGILPPYGAVITPLKSSTPIIFHSMGPILLSCDKHNLIGGFCQLPPGNPLNQARSPKGFFRGITGSDSAIPTGRKQTRS